MRSYFSTTIALFAALVATAWAVPDPEGASSRRKRHLLLTGVDFLESSEGGLPAKVWGANTGTIYQTTSLETHGIDNAVHAAESSKMKLRGQSKGKGKGAWSKSEKSKGKGKGYVEWGKACKKRKSEKSKGKGKGKGTGKGDKSSYKSKGKGTRAPQAPTRAPTRYPTTSPSTSPTDSPTETYEPTWTWCEDLYPTVSPAPTSSTEPSDTPSISLEPTESAEPSDGPSVSFEPTVSLEPTMSPEPTEMPTESAAPTITAAPTDAVPVPALPITKGFCQIYHAMYLEDELEIWNPDNVKPGQVKEAVAALTTVVSPKIPTNTTDEYKVSVTFETEGEVDTATIESTLDESISGPIALEVVGCAQEARDNALSYYTENQIVRRQLDEAVETDSDLVVMKSWDCSGEGEVTCDTYFNYVGTLGATELTRRINFAMGEYFSLMDDVTTWYPAQPISGSKVTVEETATGNVVTGIVESESQESAAGTRAAPFIGAATGLLALLLLLVLLVRRRKRLEESEVSHLKLDEEDEDDTFYGGSDEGMPKDEYNTRDVHIVGEGDSVVSHWTGYTGRQPPKKLTYEEEYMRSRDGLLRPASEGLASDVHQCSSATCDLCDEKVQTGVRFIKTGASALERKHSLPSDASREYVAEDTVML